mgnify:CR=1 FL=1
MADSRQPEPAKKAITLIAEMCGITEAMVHRLSKDGVIPRPRKRGEWDVIACVSAYIRWLKDERELVTGKELAAAFRVTEPQLSRYREAGMPQQSRGRWHWPTCVRWMVQRERDYRHRSGGVSPDSQSVEAMAQERLLAAREERLIKQLVRAEKERSLIDRAECEAGWTQLCGLVVSALEALPGRLAGTVAETTTTLAARKVLFDEARRMRAELSRAMQDLTQQARTPHSGVEVNPVAAATKRPGGKVPKPTPKPRAKRSAGA